MNTHQFDPQQLLAQHAWVRSLAKSLVFDADRVDDVVQELWLQALRRPRVVDHPGGWLNVSIRHVAAQFGRSEARRRARELAVAKTEVLPDDRRVAERAELHRDLLDRVLALDAHERTVLLMRFYDDLPPRAIAKRLGVPVGTVKSRLQRALAKLREDLDAEFGDRTSWGIALVPLATLGGPEVSRFALGRAASRLLDVPVKHALFAGVLAIVAGWFVTVQWRGEGEEPERSQAVATLPDPSSTSAAADRAPDRKGVERIAPEADAGDSRSLAGGGAVELAAQPGAFAVVDAAGRPIADAPVRWAHWVPRTSEDQLLKLGAARTASDGRVELPARGDYLVFVAPEGELATFARVTIGAELAELRLEPHGALELECVGPDGRPVAGVAVQLELADSNAWSDFRASAGPSGTADEGEPASALRSLLESAFARDTGWVDLATLDTELRTATFGRQLAAFRLNSSTPESTPRVQISGDDGKVRWRCLPIAEGYAVRVVSKHALVPSATPADALAGGATRLELDAPRRSDTLRAVAIVAGETTRRQLVVEAPCRVQGRLAPGAWPWSEPPTIEVSLERVRSPQVTERISVSSSTATSEGAFELENLSAGRLHVEACWRTADGKTVFVQTRISLASGESRDLGVLAPLDGPPLALELVFQNTDGHAVDAADVLRDPDAASWRVSVTYAANEGERDVSSASAELSTRGRIELCGLQAGAWSAQLWSPVDAQLVEGTEIRLPREPLPLVHPAAGVTQLAIDVRRTELVRVRGERRDGPLVAALSLRILREDASGERILRKQSIGVNGEAFELEPGVYRFLLSCEVGARGEPALYGEVRVAVPAGGEIVVPLAPSASLAGVLPAGVEARNGVLAFGLPGLGDERSFQSLWTARVGSDGSFRVDGLPPESRVVVMLTSAPGTPSAGRRRLVELPTGAPGEVRDVRWE